MPNVKSTKKRMKTNEQRRLRNRADRSALRSSIKRVDALLAANDTGALETAAQQTLKSIGKAKRKGIVKPNKAARLQSRVQRKINKARAAATPEATS